MTLAADTALSHSMGQKGFEVISAGGTSSTTSTITAIQSLTSATISTTAVRGDSLSSQSIPLGITIVGECTSLSVSSGTVLAYLA